MPALATRVQRVRVSASVSMTVRARALRAEGVDVIALTIGEPDFASPRHAIEAAYQAALRGETKYPPQDGTKVLKEAVQRKFKRDSGLDFALDEIAVTNGGKQSLFNALAATVDAGDEVVIPVPSWNAYPLMTQFLEGKPVFVACPQNNGFKPRPEDIEAAITPRSKMLVLNNPNNPTGACCTAEELEGIATVLRRHPQMWVISDDMYEHLMYDGRQHATLAAVAPDLRDRVITDQRRIQDLCDDGLAGRFCCRPEGRNPRHGECAGTDYVGYFNCRASCCCCCVRWTAGKRG